MKTPSLVVIIDNDGGTQSLSTPSCSGTPTPWRPTTTTAPRTTRRPVPPPTPPPATTTNPSTNGWCVPEKGRDETHNFPCDQFGHNDLFCTAVPGCKWVQTTTTARAANIDKYSTTTSRTTTTVNKPPGTPASSAVPTTKKKKKGGIVAAILIILAIAVGAGFYYAKMQSHGSAYSLAATAMEGGLDVQGALRDAQRAGGDDSDDDQLMVVADVRGDGAGGSERGVGGADDGDDGDDDDALIIMDPRLAMNATYVEMPGLQDSNA